MRNALLLYLGDPAEFFGARYSLLAEMWKQQHKEAVVLEGFFLLKAQT